MQTRGTLVEELAELTGGAVHEAGQADAIDGVVPSVVVEPATVEQASGVMKVAHREGLSVAPRGGGSNLALGNAPRGLDIIVSTRRMGEIIEHVAGDQVVRVGAGISLSELQEQLAGSGQMLGLDPLSGETVGGIVATNASGPRRLHYGTVRDLIIGITVVLADGTVAKAGGKVVKNVAGYDLSKLFTGSLGTLGLIAEANFRLHPVPQTQAAVAVELQNRDEAGEAVKRLLHSQTEPSAAELRWEDGRGSLTVLVEGLAPGVAARGEDLKAMLSDFGEVREDEFTPSLPEGETLVKLAFPPATLSGMLAGVEECGATVCGSAASGVLYAGLRGGDQAEKVARLRREARGRGGSAVIWRAPLEVKREVEAWGEPAPGTAELLRRVKGRFDPSGLLNPGRFVGGI